MIYIIYYILAGDRYEIKEYSGKENVLTIKIVNCSTKEILDVNLDMTASFKVSDISCLEISLCDNNAMIEFSYNKKGIDYLKQHDSVAYYIALKNREKNVRYFCKIHAKSLYDMQFKTGNREYIGQYEVLYIGQSKKDNIFDRLSNHKTLQRIMCDSMRNFRDKELYIMVHSVGRKLFLQQDLESYNATVIIGNAIERSFKMSNVTRDKKINLKINNDDIINIAEALLIYHFKPLYNDKLTKNNGLEKLSIYRKIGDLEINPITFSLDWFWEDSGEKMILSTMETKTLTKGSWLECKFTHDEVKINYVDIPEKIYG